MKTKIYNILLQTQRYWFLTLYFLLVGICSYFVADKYFIDKPVVLDTSIGVIEKLSKQITDLEKVVESQNRLIDQQAISIKWLENNAEPLFASNRVFEKRLQAHTEFMKRTCEYINVITIDKKITPRQCLPEYTWRREDGEKSN